MVVQDMQLYEKDFALLGPSFPQEVWARTIFTVDRKAIQCSDMSTTTITDTYYLGVTVHVTSVLRVKIL